MKTLLPVTLILTLTVFSAFGQEIPICKHNTKGVVRFAPMALDRSTGIYSPHCKTTESLTWIDPQGPGFSLPYSGAVSTSMAAFWIENVGEGIAGRFTTNNESNLSGDSYAVMGLSQGPLGDAAYFKIENPSNPDHVLIARTGGTGQVGHFQIYNPSNSESALEVSTQGSGDALLAITPGPGYAGRFDGNVFVNGDLHVGGSKNFIQPHPNDPSKELSYAAMEGPENAIFLRGTVKLIQGKAVIETPEYFRVVAGDDGITVQFTPRALESKGLAAIKVSRERIVIGELMNGRGNYEFDYFITAKRHGYEKYEPIQPNKHFKADNVTRERFEEQYAKMDDMSIVAIRNLLISNGILTKEGKLNMETVRRLGWTLKEAEVAQNQK